MLTTKKESRGKQNMTTTKLHYNIENDYSAILSSVTFMDSLLDGANYSILNRGCEPKTGAVDTIRMPEYFVQNHGDEVTPEEFFQALRELIVDEFTECTWMNPLLELVEMAMNELKRAFPEEKRTEEIEKWIDGYEEVYEDFYDSIDMYCEFLDKMRTRMIW